MLPQYHEKKVILIRKKSNTPEEKQLSDGPCKKIYIFTQAILIELLLIYRNNFYDPATKPLKIRYKYCKTNLRINYFLY